MWQTSEKKLVSAVKLKVTYVLKLIARFGRHCHLLIQWVLGFRIRSSSSFQWGLILQVERNAWHKFLSWPAMSVIEDFSDRVRFNEGTIYILHINILKILLLLLNFYIKYSKGTWFL